MALKNKCGHTHMEIKKTPWKNVKNLANIWSAQTEISLQKLKNNYRFGQYRTPLLIRTPWDTFWAHNGLF